MIVTGNKLTNMQLELIKMFKYNLDDTQLNEVKELLSKYFTDKIDNEMDKFWQQNEWTDSKIESIANQHNRTIFYS